MRALWRILVAICVMVFGYSAAVAHGPDGKPPAQEKPLPGVFRLPKHLEPTPEQQAKIDALVAEFLPKLRELEQQEEAVWTAEQKAARDAARKAAHAEGLRGPEANRRVDQAAKLSAEQAARREQIHTAKKALESQIRDAVLSLLSDEQREALEKPEKKPEKKGPPHHPKPKPEPQKPEKKGPPHHEKEAAQSASAKD